MVDKTPAELDPGTPSDTSIVHASENGVSTNSKGHGERDISRLQGTAPLYSSSKTYNLNDLVTESGTIFRNTTAITVPEAFNPSKWDTSGGEVNTASNLGGGDGVFAQKNGVDLEFKSLVAGDNISLTSDADEITITGEDITIDVRNTSGSLISKGSTVYITGASGNNVTVDLALASGTSTIPSIGIVLDDIANNSNGQVVNAGKITNLNTSSFSVGDTLFVSALTAGDLTSTAPLHPNLRQSMAVVLVSNVTIGEIQVITGDVSGAESGTIFNTFAVGDGLAGTKAVSFVNAAGTFTADSAHTANRTQSFQDTDGTIALLADIVTAPSIVLHNVNTEALTGLSFFAFSGADPDSTTELNAENCLPVACRVQNITIRVSTQTDGISTVKTRKNNADGNGLINIPASTTGTFRDTVNTDDFLQNDFGNYAVEAIGAGTLTVDSLAMEVQT